jgi:hypothetical protein
MFGGYESILNVKNLSVKDLKTSFKCTINTMKNK